MLYSMIEIEAIRDGHGLFCPACGTATIVFGPGETKINDCRHLQFAGADDGDPSIDKHGWRKQAEASGGGTAHYMDHMRKTLDDNFVCFTQCIPAPSGFCGYTIYEFTEDVL